MRQADENTVERLYCRPQMLLYTRKDSPSAHGKIRSGTEEGTMDTEGPKMAQDNYSLGV